MSEEKIVTLEATQGKNEGEAIGSHSRSIVFLPRGTTPGKEVRVRLEPIMVGGEPKLDRNQRPMYRGLPAPDITSESWKDNGDGTATRVSISTNWKGEAREVGVLETKALEKRDGGKVWRSEYKISGQDFTSSRVEEIRKYKTALEEQKVNGSAIEWRNVGYREEPEEIFSYPVKEIRIKEDGGIWTFRLAVQKEANQTAYVKVVFTKPDGRDEAETIKTTWVELPAWLQSQFEARFPVCVCGRSRYDAQNSDGYSKCEECRKEECCVRCGKQAQVKNLSGRLVCSDCEAYEKAEQLINAVLANEMRTAIASEAKELFAGQAIEGATGEMILRNTLDHIEDHSRNQFMRKWAGYGWYYFCESGVYGAKLAPAALQILQFLPQANGNGLVEMVAWIASQTKPSDPDWDYYLQTQVRGEKRNLPHLTAEMLTQIKLADRLRGSENDRIAAVSGYKGLVEKLGPEFGEVKAVAKILQDTKQDYVAALAKIREIEMLIAAKERGEILLNFSGYFRHMGENDQSDTWVIDPDGQEVEAKIEYRKRYTSEGSKTWSIVREDCLVLRWSRHQAARIFFESWEVVKLPKNGVTQAQREMVRAIEPHERFHGPGSGFDLSRVGTNACLASRDIGAEQFDVPKFGAKPIPRQLKKVERSSYEEPLEEAPDSEDLAPETDGDEPKSAEDMIKAMNSKWNI